MIAIHAVFQKPPLTAGDSVLTNEIQKAGNVILSFLLKDNKLVSSDSAFVKSSHSLGLVSYGEVDNIVTDFQVFTILKDQLIWSFPAITAGNFDFRVNQRIMEKAKANKGYNIVIYSDKVESNALPKALSEINCELIKDKIVIFGYLGPQEEDMFLIRKNGETKKIYRTIILGNIVVSILQDQFNESGLD